MEDAMRSLRFACLFAIFISVVALAQNNPVPLINQPLVPDSVKPGSGGFTLTVNGTGFASDAVVNWNGSPRATEIISSSQLKATIEAADVAKVGTASVTVVNPTPRGGSSNVIYFPVRTSLSSVAFAGHPTAIGEGVIAVGDFNNDGKLDVALGQENSDGNGWTISLFRGNGDGTFKPPIKSVFTGFTAVLYQLTTADFNNDGKLDLAANWAYGGDDGTDILLNNGDGTFRHTKKGTIDPGVFADLNGDGFLDAVTTGGGYDQGVGGIWLGDGKGGFKSAGQLNIPAEAGLAAIGDFNHDGILDVAIPGINEVLVFLGEGGGSFPQNGVSYSTTYGDDLVAADVNGDGNLDLINSGCVLLGKGDGTFTEGTCTSIPFDPVTVGDFNGDGKLDLAGLTNQHGNQVLLIALGNGDGTFRTPIEMGAGLTNNVVGFAAGDFNGDGKLDIVATELAGTPVFLQTTASVTPDSLAFGDQDVGTKGQPQTVILKNIGTSALKVNGITIIGANPKDFSENNNCGASLPPGGSCKIQVTFGPKAVGNFTASVQVAYQGIGSPQLVSLSGTGVAAATVSLTPSKLTFSDQLIGTTSLPQTATLTNTGSVVVTISKISATAPFSQTNNCPSSLPVDTDCQIQVSFKPTAKGPASRELSVTDNATGSPQTVALSGAGTVVKLSPEGVNFGDEKVGTKSAAVPVQLTNTGKTALSITKIAITGTDAGDFSQTNNCGTTVPAGGSCTIKVTFQPTTTGSRSANLAVSDDGGGSPQEVALAGTGT
jgi:hypothetical protein